VSKQPLRTGWTNPDNEESILPLTQIVDDCLAQVQIKFTRGLANSFVLEHSGDAIETTNAPQEEQHW
jgi:hypothetical protein